MEKARHDFGFAPEDYEIKKMKSTLAHFDNNTQSILINPYIVMYAKEIVEYVVFHQFCHLKYKTHSKTTVCLDRRKFSLSDNDAFIGLNLA